MLNKHTYWKLNDIIDYDNFMSQATKEGYHWLGGQEPCNSTLRTCVLNTADDDRSTVADGEARPVV